MAGQLPLYRPYIHSLPYDVKSMLDGEECLGPPGIYAFQKYYRETTLLRMLQKWVTGRLRHDCCIRHLNIYHYTPIQLLEHYNGRISFTRPSWEIKPVWFFTHLSCTCYTVAASRFIRYSSEDGHWILQDGAKEIRAIKGKVMGSMRKAIYYTSNTHTGKCGKTEVRMKEYTLASYPGARARSLISDSKVGEWMLVRIYVIRQKNRNACTFQPRRIQYVRQLAASLDS